MQSVLTPELHATPRSPVWRARLLFTMTPLFSAVLVFSVQPMLAKLILPNFGGAAAVWTTCMMFYQVALLVGYAYADLLTRRLPLARQAILHCVLLLLPLCFLPFHMPEHFAAPSDANPVLALLGLLLVTVGVSFVAVSTTAPTLQAWFAQTDDPRARDPYFLYAASNAGSLLGLFIYPLILEPSFGLRVQTTLWAGGYLVFVLLIAACAFHAARARGPATHTAAPAAPAASPPRASLRQAGLWLVYAMIPSSLMLSVTSTLTTDIAPIPFLWVLPLAAYLLSFVVAFHSYPPWLRKLVHWACPFALTAQVFLLIAPNSISTIRQMLAVQTGTFFVIATAFHGELALRRPAVSLLTRYYLVISIGGALGGLFNSVLAPCWFSWHAELPIVLLLAVGLTPGLAPAGRMKGQWAWLAFPPAWALQSLCLLRGEGLSWNLRFALAVALALPQFVRPWLCAVSLAAIMTAGLAAREADVLYRERSFFSVSRVRAVRSGGPPMRVLSSGKTDHGAQLLDDDPARRRIPLTYYFHTSPIGQMFQAFQGRAERQRVAIIGLGAGTLASYAEPGQEFTFLEIDPAVIRIASDPRLFTYLGDCRGRCRVLPGDGRMSLKQVPDGYFDFLICDAFSGDAIPTHLLTVEAVRLYLQKSSVRGVLAFHLSNLYVDLQSVVGNVAKEAGLLAFVNDDRSRQTQTPEEKRLGKRASTWVALVRRPEDLAGLAGDPRWQALAFTPAIPVWTDDTASLWPVLRWRLDRLKDGR